MKLTIATYYENRSWFASCRKTHEPGIAGWCGMKRSQAAAISGAIGMMFRKLEGREVRDEFPELYDRELTLIIEVERRGDKYIGRCYEESFPDLRGYSGPRTTELAAAKRALGTYFHVRGNNKKEGAHARA